MMMIRATTTTVRVTRIGALNNSDEASSEGRSRAMRDDDGKDGMDVSSSFTSFTSKMMMMTTQKAMIDDFLTRAGDTARASAERYDFASAFVGSMLCATWFVMRGQSVETACGIVFCATITAVVAEELLQDVERDGGGR